ncbi:MAG: hypothetical protein JSU03_00400 [Bacteroidetes bacterium]|nr:hypothetical protein [Bacteroidota bacterium]
MLQHQLFNTVFKSPFEDAGTAKQMEEVIAEYPYFALAHYYLLKKTPPTAANHDGIAAATALHFDNSFYLNQLLTGPENHMYAVPPIQQEAEIKLENVPAITTEKTEGEPSQISTTEEGATDAPLPQSQSSLETTTPEPEAAVPIHTNVHTEESSPAQESNAEAAKEELLFEPLYTTDYFASQGIKLSDTPQADDKLGKHLKSFTAWLKTMKKTHEYKLPEGNEQLERIVQVQAEKSNKEDEILTEAMAEACIQQGKILKAIEIYTKLSLLNPAKSAFFAAKIEHLK